MHGRFCSFVQWGLLLTASLLSDRLLADTNFPRQLAKDNPHVLIFPASSDAANAAQRLQNSILNSPDNKKKKREDVPILTVEEIQSLASDEAKLRQSSRIFLVLTKDLEKLPPNLRNLMPVGAVDAKDRVSMWKSECLNKVAGKLTFSIAFIAPDEARLMKMTEIFKNASYGDYKQMTKLLGDSYSTFKLALFSDEACRQKVETWGTVNDPHIWSSTEWHSLSDYDKMTQDQLSECNQIFFFDRNHHNQTVPKPVADLISSQPLNETTTFIKKTDIERGLSIAVFSTPNDLILERKIRRYPHLSAIPSSPVIEEATDLRHIGRTTLLISGQGTTITPGEEEQIRLRLAKDMRTNLRLNVEERGDILRLLQKEVTLQELTGATGTATLLRTKGKLRYIWHFTIQDYNGKTEYNADQQLLTTEKPPSYQAAHGTDDPEPVEPTLGFFAGRGAKAEYKLAYVQWEPLHNSWLHRKANYEERITANFPYQWSRKVTCISSASSRGILRLLDLQDKDGVVKIIWEKECSSTSSSNSKLHLSDTVTVKGQARPDSLQAPPNTSECSMELRREAAVGAGNSGFGILQETAWLPSEGGGPVAQVEDPKLHNDRSAPKPGKSDDPGKSTAVVGIYVASIEKGVVTTTYPDGKKVKLGDLMIVTKSKEIKDPKTGETLETRQIPVSTLRVTRVSEKTIDSVPLNSLEAKNLDQIKEGMSVTWKPATTPPPVRPPIKKAGKKGHSK